MIDATNWNREQATIALREVIRLAFIDIERRRKLNDEHRGDPSWRYVRMVTAANANVILRAISLLDRMWGIGVQRSGQNSKVTFVCVEGDKKGFESLVNCTPSFVPTMDCVERMAKQVLRNMRRFRGTSQGASVKNSKVPFVCAIGGEPMHGHRRKTKTESQSEAFKAV